ncbi:MAG TPA: tRNA uracil 4-sulfurtransferase ThiI [Thermoanaerobaculaceae bacterium]|nr:tRNA uracil 4-sulfurtransferase ThiI [Thermoanaerobaculaceae bacterium]
MDSVSYVIATVHEVALKGGNRGFFERTLVQNVRAALKGLPVAEVSIPARIVIRFAEPVAWFEVRGRLETVFGINGIMPVERVGTTYEQLERFVSEHAAGFVGATFAVRCKRSDKRFPMTSEEVNRRLGAFVNELTGKAVDLENPDLTLHVIVQNDGLYLYTDRVAGPGGLPVGTSGRVLVLLSGGIDSPVAAYLAMKRGTKAHYVHFHSAPYTSDSSVTKVERLVRILTRHQGASRLAVVPFGDCQREIVSSCPERLRVVLYRRMMLRTAERIARRWRCEALVTGESLNQVASQTLENMAAIDRVAHMPVLRPLIGLDKQEIIGLAERAGTFETSILPHQDCCSFLQPQHPATRTTAGACEEAETAVDVEEWARRLQHGAAVTVVQHRWDA